MARPARAWQSPVAPGPEAWEDFVGEGGGEGVLHPAIVLPLESPTLSAANWHSDMAAASLRAYAALFCPVTGALGIRFMT